MMYLFSQRQGLACLFSEVEPAENVLDEFVEVTIQAIKSVVFKGSPHDKVELSKLF